MRETYLPIYKQVLSLRRTDAAAASALAAQTAEEAREAGDAAIATFFDALSLRVREQHDEAIPLFEQCRDAEGFPLPGQLFYELGRAHGECEKPDYRAEIEFYHKALAEESYDTPGYAWNNMGVAYGNLGDHEKAIECFRKALAEESYETPGDAWHNMGVAYGKLGEYDKAIEFYQKALAEESFDTRGDAWNNMGSAYANLGKHDKAIECYRKALAEESFDTPGDAWNNMGSAYANLGKHDKAIECYTKAVDTPRGANAGHAWYNMGLAYRDAGRIAPARTAFENAIHEYKSQEDTVRADQAGKRLAALEGPDEDPADQVALRTQETGTKEPFADWATSGPESGLDDVFVLLKDWSGSSPYVAAIDPEAFERQPILGGGYFLKWNGRGTVIDPGIGFVTNFLSESFHSCEVQHVLTTHMHIDHTADLMALQNLHKEYCDALARHKGTGGTSRSPHPLTHFWDRRTFRIGPYIKTCAGEDGPHELSPSTQPQLPPEADMTVRAVDSGHCGDSVALLFVMKVAGKERLRIGLTSDAAPEAAGTLTQEFHDCDVIILHFSKRDTPDRLTGQVKESHLAIGGCIEIIKGTNAQVYVVAEFSAEDRKDDRILDTRTIRELAETEATVLPADIGLTLQLPREQGDPVRVRCSRCKQPCEAKDIVVQTPQPFQRITYVCSECRL